MDQPDDAQRGAFSIDTFCQHHEISKPTYFKMRAAGCGPEEMRIPGTTVVRISVEAAREWRARLQNPAPDVALKIEAAKRKMRDHGSHASRSRKMMQGKAA